MKFTIFLRTVLAVGLLCCSGKKLSAETWKLESVDAIGTPARYTSMKIDSFGNVHVAYVLDDGNHYPLRYAMWDHSLKRWFEMTVDQNAGSCSLTLDSTQHPHLSYTEFTGGHLKYGHWDGTNWRSEVVPINAMNISYYNSIALTPDDRPNISFYEYEGARDSGYRIRLRTVLWDGQVWGLRTVDSQSGSGKFNAMAADRQGHLHLVYANVSASTGSIRYAFWDGRSWKTEILEGEKDGDGHAVGWSCSIALDSDGNPHITYMDEAARFVKYAVRKDGRWKIEVIGRVQGVGYPDRNSIAIDSHGVPYIGYFDAGSGSLHVAHPEGQKWLIETVDGDGAGFTSSMQIDNDVIWISYSDGASGGLKVASRQLKTSTAVDTRAAAGHAQSGQ
jgi:hypothetical protein